MCVWYWEKMPHYKKLVELKKCILNTCISLLGPFSHLYLLLLNLLYSLLLIKVALLQCTKSSSHSFKHVLYKVHILFPGPVLHFFTELMLMKNIFNCGNSPLQCNWFILAALLPKLCFNVFLFNLRNK